MEVTIDSCRGKKNLLASLVLLLRFAVRLSIMQAVFSMLMCGRYIFGRDPNTMIAESLVVLVLSPCLMFSFRRFAETIFAGQSPDIPIIYQAAIFVLEEVSYTGKLLFIFDVEM